MTNEQKMTKNKRSVANIIDSYQSKLDSLRQKKLEIQKEMEELVEQDKKEN